VPHNTSALIFQVIALFPNSLIGFGLPYLIFFVIILTYEKE